MKARTMMALVMASVISAGLLAGCGGAASTAESTASTGGDAKTYKVALVVNQPFGDLGSMDSLAAGADKAAAEFGVEVAKLESETASFEDDIRAMAEQGYDLIITTFGYMQDAMIAVSKEYPDTKFCGCYQTINVDGAKYDNIWDVEFHGEQAFYVAGYMAGLYSKSKLVGIQVGGEEPSPNAEANGFMRGVNDAGTGCKAEFAYAGGYGDPATAKEKALAMIADGCDFIQNDSGASNAGVVEAAKENGIATAGEITDYWDTYDGFQGIIDINFGTVSYDAIQDLVNGQFKGGEHSIFGLAEDGYAMNWESYERYAEKNAEFKDIVEQGKAIEEKIKAGEIVVDYNTAAPSWEVAIG